MKTHLYIIASTTPPEKEVEWPGKTIKLYIDPEDQTEDKDYTPIVKRAISLHKEL